MPMQTSITRALACAAAALVGAALLLPTGALAHERRTIADGKYDATVAWDTEPAYQGQKNAASIRIAQAGTSPAEPVEGAEKTLKVRVRQGSTTREFSLRAVSGQPGYYVADLIPTREGDYEWTFVGNVNGEAVNATFDTADGKFNSVQPATAMQFPQAVPDSAQSATALRTARLDAESARVLGYVGLGLGVLGLLAAVVGWRARLGHAAEEVEARAEVDFVGAGQTALERL